MKTKKIIKKMAILLTAIFLVLPLISFANRAAMPLVDYSPEEASQGAMVLQDETSETIKTENDQIVVSDNYVESCSKCLGVGNTLSISAFIGGLLYVFLALILWAASPIGILFFLAAKTLFSKESSKLNRTIAWITQGIAFLLWFSAMILLLIIYFDSISLRVFNLGGSALNLAISSGLAFAITMFLIVLFEKRVKNSKDRDMNDRKKEKREEEREEEEREEEEREEEEREEENSTDKKRARIGVILGKIKNQKA